MSESLITDLLIILTSGLLAALVCRWLQISVLIGYLLVGAIIGKGVLGWVVDESHQLEHIAEAGVFLLLFSIGLEFSIDDLKRLGRNLFIGGAVQMLLVAIPITVVLITLEMAWQSAVLIAAAIAFSSTVLVFKSLSERGASQKSHGRRAIGILLFQDGALIPLLLLVPLLTGNGDGTSLVGYLSLAVVSALFVVAILGLRFALAEWIIPLFAGYRSPELVILFTVVSLGAITFVASNLGLPPAVGAFAAGLIFNGNRWTHQIDALVLPFRETFAAVFFVGLGLIFDPRLIWEAPLLMVSLLVATICLKSLAAAAALRLTGLSWTQSFGMGLGLAHVGEFALVLVLLGVESGVLTEADYQTVIAIAVGSLILTPALMNAGLRLIHDDYEEHQLSHERKVLSNGNLATVIGAGPIGRRISSQLETCGKDVCLVDLSPINLHQFAMLGFRTVAGDGSDVSILLHAQVDKAEVNVVCVPSDEMAIRVVRAIRQLNETAELIVRCRYQANIAKLQQLGATRIVSEESEASAAMIRSLNQAPATLLELASEPLE